MDKPNKYQTALVTGGTRGIGFAVAEALLKKGMKVLICGTTEEGVKKAVNELKQSHPAIEGRVCDIRRHEQVKELVQEAIRLYGRLDVLVNNAGIGRFSSVEKMSPEDWRATIDTNLSGLFYCCHEAIPHMKKGGGGYIINIGSLAGKNYFPGGSAYGASKAGLIAVSEALMQELRYDHIRVSYIMPGSVETGFSAPAPQSREKNSKTWKLLPQDVAGAIVFLLDSDPRGLQSRIEMRPSEPAK